MSKEEDPLSRNRGAEPVDACRDRQTERNEAAVETESRVRTEKLRQDHIIALQAKEDEVRCKDNIIAELKNKIVELERTNSSLSVENGQLKIENKVLREEREEKAELQREVYALNERLNALDPIQRDYEDALNTIARQSAENEVLRGSKEKYYEETRQFREQVVELTHYLNYERENKQISQISIRNLGFEIERLKAEINDWKDKFETEVKKRVENCELVKNRKLKYVVVDDRHENTEEDTLSGREESFKRQSDMVNVSRAKRPNSTDHYHQPENDSCEPVGTSEDQPQPRKKRFELVPCSVPRCKNCDTVFLNEDLMATECSFHRAPPQNYQVWTRLNNQETVRVNPRLKDHMFWPCCESHGRARTKGCMVLKHHEIVYPGD